MTDNRPRPVPPEPIAALHNRIFSNGLKLPEVLARASIDESRWSRWKSGKQAIDPDRLTTISSVIDTMIAEDTVARLAQEKAAKAVSKTPKEN